eukprot:GHVS01028092.1.p1 GENE.GHVS01028092.1~~GHVS01028092.1.p1  ORF type:complete len:186 (+),score=23.87 GHVS01028092.1:491-1048(+)
MNKGQGGNCGMSITGGTSAEGPWSQSNETKSSQVGNYESQGVSFELSRRTPSSRLREMLQEAEDMSDYLFERSVDCFPCLSSFVSSEPDYYRRPVPQSELDVSETSAAATEVRRKIFAPHMAAVGLGQGDPLPRSHTDELRVEQENVCNSTDTFAARGATVSSSSEPRRHWSLCMPKPKSSRGEC